MDGTGKEPLQDEKEGSKMIIDMEKVAWLSREEIQKQSMELLGQWEAFSGRKLAPPIPVEAIAEKYLDISVGFDDLEEMLGIPDILGATWVEERRMVINSSLLNGVEGRVSFTCSHEIGHWILHRKYLQGQFTRKNPVAGRDNPTVVCRASASRQRGEWQADYFSGCLLMPQPEVENAFKSVFGPHPLIMYNEKSCFNPKNPLVVDPAHDSAKEIARKVIGGGNFTNVSKEAMCYRLLAIGLLINRAGRPLGESFEIRNGERGRAKGCIQPL
jgi:Zn-dependent peptidase ImmA (M78 family)